MTQRDHLNQYIHHLHQRLRLAATLRGAALLTAAALLGTVALALFLNHFAFPEHALTPARLALLAALLLSLGLAAMPLIRLTRSRAVTRAESHFRAFEQRLTTFTERQTQQDPFLDLLAADTLTVAAEAPPKRLIPTATLALFLAAAIAATGILTWLVKARPGALGYGASLLWTGPHHEIPPLYDIRVAPGDIAVRRNTDQIVTAQITGLDPAKVTLLARFASAPAWQRVPMQPQPDTPGFQFLFAGLPEDVEYYVEAGPAASPHFHIRTVDLPAVKQIQVTYRYPKWTGMQTVSKDQAGDLRALEGTEADLTITMSAPLKEGMLALDGAQTIKLSGGEANKYHATIHMAKDGAYHLAALDNGQQVRLSEDYFLSTSKANPPTIAIDRPTADYRASPIEEVRIGLKATAEFPLHHVALHYSVNGAPEQTVNVLKAPGAKSSDGATTLPLEDFHLVPGDVVSLYATAADAHAEARTEISFVQIEPFEREFSQSQSGGGGGEGGGQQPNSQTDIARREKELIEATWKQRNDKAATAQQAAATAKLLAEAQSKLRDQALALTARMESRDLSQANEEFNSFGKDMQTAAAAMVPSADKLAHQQWQDAMPIEQKALQALLRAEATFRKIEVAFGQKGGGGGGGAGSAGRDLASLFDLEMDTEKNQYETAQTGSAAEQQAKKVDDALAKLDALTRRQEELAQQQQTAQQTFQQRWQQEMLRREAEQLQREMEQMQAQQKGQQGQQGQSGQQGQQGQQSQSGQQSASSQPGQSGQSGQSGLSQGGQSQSGGQSSGQSGSESGKQSAANRANSPQADPLQRTVQQSLDRLRAANEEMRRAAGQSQQQSAAEARRAAEQLREATNLLGGAQKQQATGKLDSLANEAARLAQQEAAQADRIRSLSSQSNGQGNGMEPQTAQSYQERAQQRAALAGDRQRLSDDLSHLQRDLRDTARQLAPNQPAASNNLRDALSAMDQEDLTNLTQRTADWLRRGINPNSNGTEAQIAGGLKKLDDQIRQAQQATGSSSVRRPGQGNDPGTQTAALDHVDRLRNQLQALSGQADQGRQGRQSGQQGQPGNQPGKTGQQGQGQPGQQGQGGRQGQGSQPGQGNQQGGQPGGSQNAQSGSPSGKQQGGNRQGDIAMGGRIQTGGGGTAPNWNVNTGNNTYANGGPAAPSNTPNPADTERTIRQGLNELNQLRTLAKTDPAAQKEIDSLIREMQRLDPARFPGNPAMVEQLHAQVLAGVDKLELQLRHDAAPNATQVRATAPPLVPAGYQDAVANYFRRLGQTR